MKQPYHIQIETRKKAIVVRCGRGSEKLLFYIESCSQPWLFRDLSEIESGYYRGIIWHDRNRLDGIQLLGKYEVME